MRKIANFLGGKWATLEVIVALYRNRSDDLKNIREHQ